MDKIPQIFLFFFVTSLTSLSIQAQLGRFNVGFVAGLNFSELEGESIIDYYGINAGLKSTMRVNQKGRLGLEFLYSVNGEYVLPEFYPNIRYGKIKLQYLEIPLNYSYRIQVTKNEQIFHFALDAGLVYTNLFKWRIEDDQGLDVTHLIEITVPSNIHAQLGLTYFFNKQLALNLKTTLPGFGLDWTIAVRGVWMFG